MDLQEIIWEGMDWIDLAQDMDRPEALLNLVLNLRVPWNVGNFVAGKGMVKHLKKDSVAWSQSVNQLVN